MPGCSYKIRTENLTIMNRLKLRAGCSEGGDESEDSVKGGSCLPRCPHGVGEDRIRASSVTGRRLAD
jgi:hypothetical protein